MTTLDNVHFAGSATPAPDASCVDAAPIAGELRRAASHHIRGELAEAEAIYRSVLAREPDCFHALYFLGVLCHATGRLAEAAERIEKALDVAPRSAEAAWGLGRVRSDLGDFAVAVDRYRRAIVLKPDFPAALNDMGIALHKLGRLPAALGAFERVLALDGHHANASANMSTVLKELGRIDEAVAAARRAIEIEPTKPGYYLVLTESRQLDDGDPHFAAMEALTRDMASLPALDQMHLHFALGKAYRDQGRHEQSFRHLLAANALKRRQIDYDEAATLALLGNIRTAFTPALLSRKKSSDERAATPVFIMGMPRSGSTLVEQILASHPLVFGAGEITAFETVAASIVGKDRTLATLEEALSAVTAERLRGLGAAYLARVRSIAPNAERITDKNLSNFRFAGLIHLALPNARMIHVRRDPVATCLSCFSKLFTDGQFHTYDLGELGRYYRAYEALMGHWRRVLPEGVMLEVRYEDVVEDLEQQARRIVAHCGLPWHDACLAFHKTQRPIRTASAAQVRRPIYRNSLGGWRLEDALLRPLLEGLANDRARRDDTELPRVGQRAVAADALIRRL
jgi:tetratricopeptide (TPR) repeat protein